MNYYTTDNENKIIETSIFGCEPHWLNCNQTEEEIVRYDGQLMLKSEFDTLSQTTEYIAEQLKTARTAKLSENDTKAEQARYGKTFTVAIQEQECLFDTKQQTQTDLLTAFAVTSLGLTYDGWVTNNGISLDLTANDVVAISNAFKVASNIYPEWNVYFEAINNAQTVEELNNIIIDYGEV